MKRTAKKYHYKSLPRYKVGDFIQINSQNSLVINGVYKIIKVELSSIDFPSYFLDRACGYSTVNNIFSYGSEVHVSSKKIDPSEMVEVLYGN